MAMTGLRTIIALSFVLAIGFLLCILSAALFGEYLTLLVVAIYALAPLPNFVCAKCATPDDFLSGSDGNSNAVVDFGRFLTGIMVVAGIALPILLAHCGVIEIAAMIMSICGGLLIYGTIISFTMFFADDGDDF